MKKILVILILFPVFVQAQIQDYVQFGAGAGSLNSFVIQGEYGKTWKWLDVGMSIDYESWNLPLGTEYSTFLQYNDNGYGNGFYVTNSMYNKNIGGETLFALRLNARVNVVRLFVENSRHAIKIGGGIGYARMNELNLIFSKDDKNFVECIKNQDSFLSPSCRVSYEYSITPKMTIGVFAFGNLCLDIGLSLRRNF
ncbi:MAG: hypothetical protein LBR48_01635 [Dysgonamonadaceae bacterium]|jgi:hypothetical protein|nr:hypothetical protein [Dysgonamonadaceae bacterium]